MKKTKTSPQTIGIIGLGIMGGIMAETLLMNNFTVCGFDIVPDAMKRLKKAKGQGLKSVREVILESDVVISSLATSQALLEVFAQIKETLIEHPKKIILIETST